MSSCGLAELHRAHLAIPNTLQESPFSPEVMGMRAIIRDNYLILSCTRAMDMRWQGIQRVQEEDKLFVLEVPSRCSF